MMTGTTSQNEHLAYLDGWRGLAILSVMVGHFSGITWLGFGAFGVDLFFVLSGRLMADILVVRGMPFGVFAQRRFSRIWPVAAAFSLALLVLTPAIPFVGRWAVDWWSFVRGAFFLSGNENALGDMPHTMAHLWSVAIEAQSYLVLAALVAISRMWTKVNILHLALLVAVAAMAWGLWQAWAYQAGGHDLYWRVEVRLASIVGGFGGHLLLRSVRFGGQVAPILFAAALALHASILPEWPAYSLGTVFLVVAVNAVDCTSGLAMTILRNRYLGWAGLISYSLYVWHGPFYMWQWTFGTVPMLIISVVVAACSYWLLEVPCRRAINSIRAPYPFAQRRIRSEG